MSGGKTRRQGESGEVMLEAAIIVPMVLILLLALLSIAFLFYQSAMMSSIASEIAADVAKNYKYTGIEVGARSIAPKDAESVPMFRMNFGRKSMEKAHGERAARYAAWRVALTTLGMNPGEVTSACKVVNSGIGRAYVQVTVSQTTDFFLSGVLELVQVADRNTAFSATAYAECMDLMGYTSTVNFARYMSGKLKSFNDISALYQSWKKLAEAIRN